MGEVVLVPRDTQVTWRLRSSQSRPPVSDFPAPVPLWRIHTPEATSSPLSFQGYILKKQAQTILCSKHSKAEMKVFQVAPHFGLESRIRFKTHLKTALA